MHSYWQYSNYVKPLEKLFPCDINILLRRHSNTLFPFYGSELLITMINLDWVSAMFLASRVWSFGDRVSRIDNDISSSWVSFCLPNATAPLVTIIHSRPSKWHSATCRKKEKARKNEWEKQNEIVVKIKTLKWPKRKEKFTFHWYRKSSKHLFLFVHSSGERHRNKNWIKMTRMCVHT